MFDTFHGGCGGSVAAIQAGIFVQAGSDSEAEEVQQFESLTGRISLGDVRLVQPDRLPYFHIWFSCSSCKNFANLVDKKGNKGTKGGNMFEAQFTLAAAAKAKVVVLENVAYGRQREVMAVEARAQATPRVAIVGAMESSVAEEELLRWMIVVGGVKVGMEMLDRIMKVRAKLLGE